MRRGRVNFVKHTGVRIAIWVFVLVSAFAAQPAFAQDAARTCSLATLTGLYLFDASGHVITPNGPVPKAVVEFLNIAGDGTLTALATANVGGTVIAHNLHGTGSYTVNEDCTGTLAFNPQGPHFDIYIAPLGTQFHMIQTDQGHVLAGKVTRLSRVPAQQ